MFKINKSTTLSLEVLIRDVVGGNVILEGILLKDGVTQTLDDGGTKFVEILRKGDIHTFDINIKIDKKE